MNRTLSALAATLALATGSHAALLVEDFESYSSVGDDMNGKGSWLVTNGTQQIVPEGPVVILDAYTWDVSAQSATVGGVQSTLGGISSLYNNSFGVPLVSTTPMMTSFKVETAYTESTAGFRNNFSFVLNASSGNLLTLNFTPDALGEYEISWSSDFAAGGLVGTKLANVSTQFQMDTWWNGSAVAYELSNAGTSVSTGTLSGQTGSELINGFAVNWDSASNGGLGNNSITIDNVSVVPEPSSALLGLLGASFVFLRRRKA